MIRDFNYAAINTLMDLTKNEIKKKSYELYTLSGEYRTAVSDYTLETFSLLPLMKQYSRSVSSDAKTIH